MTELTGRVVLVSGGGSELGAAIAMRLAEEGASIAILDSDGAKAARTAGAVAGSAIAVPVDVRSAGDAVRAVELTEKEFGRIDALVNAGEHLSTPQPLARRSEEDFLETFAVMVHRARHLMNAVLPSMRRLKGGSIVNLVTSFGDSLSGTYVADGKTAGHALRGLTRAAAAEWGRYGIRVNALVAAADTEAFRQFRAMQREAVDWAIAQNPLRRMGNPKDDIGGAVLFLVSDDGRHITGETIHADGGQHISPAIFDPGLVKLAD